MTKPIALADLDTLEKDTSASNVLRLARVLKSVQSAATALVDSFRPLDGYLSNGPTMVTCVLHVDEFEALRAAISLRAKWNGRAWLDAQLRRAREEGRAAGLREAASLAALEAENQPPSFARDVLSRFGYKLRSLADTKTPRST